MSDAIVLLVGESNPYGNHASFALYDEPPQSAGGRLRRLVLGMSHRDYMRQTARANCCTGRWSIPAARVRAAALDRADASVGPTACLNRTPIVLLGAKVAQAFGLAFVPYTTQKTAAGRTALILPHPSGLSRAWNEPGAFLRVRRAVADLVPDLAVRCTCASKRTVSGNSCAECGFKVVFGQAGTPT